MQQTADTAPEGSAKMSILAQVDHMDQVEKVKVLQKRLGLILADEAKKLAQKAKNRKLNRRPAEKVKSKNRAKRKAAKASRKKNRR